MALAGTGKISWFGGPHDPGAQGKPASGRPITQPGISLYRHDTLGGYWLTRLPNGVIAILQQTDIGPHPSTHRTYDYTYSALPLLGYTEKNFPTDKTASAVYLGKDLTSVSTSLHPALNKLGASNQQILQFISQVDTGSIERGHAFAVDRKGAQPRTSDPAGTGAGSSAISSPILPDPGVASAVGGAVSGVSDFLSYITSGDFLKLVLGGAVLLVALVEVGHQAKG